jgi:FMN phosphatase YigB (HAD superfamily)
LAAVFFFDCDNTLLDNDRVRADMDEYLAREFGDAGRTDYWAHYERLRTELGYADYLGAVQRLRIGDEGDPRLSALSCFLLEYPFADRVYPGALETLARCGERGTTAILSDGDVVFQPRKLRRSGLWDAVAGRVHLYVHKEKMLDDVLRRRPADRYVMIDDKLTILTAMKAVLRERLVTVWPRQGHYAADAAANARCPAPDLAIDHIGELTHSDLSSLLAESR